jgi:hypothetical protein
MSSSTGTVVFNDSRIKATGVIATESIGVGTANPTSNLHVVGDASIQSNLEVGTANLFVDTTTGRVGVGTMNPSVELDVVGDASIQSNLEVGTANLYVDTTTGRVGVGTMNPYTNLHIKRSDAPSGTITSDDYYLLLGQNENGVGKEWRIGFGYNISTTNVPPAYIGYHEKYNSSSTYGDLVFGARTNATGSTQATEHMRITHDGNVGIGTTNPVAKLHVNGTFYSPGSVVQLQTRTFCLGYNTTSTTFTDTGAYVDITPKFNNSKLFVLFDGLAYLNSSAACGISIRGFRSIGGGTDQRVYSAIGFAGSATSPHDLSLYQDPAGYHHSRISLSFSDIPNTSSSIRYKIYASAHVSGRRIYLGNGGHQPLTFSVFEIAQ